VKKKQARRGSEKKGPFRVDKKEKGGRFDGVRRFKKGSNVMKLQEPGEKGLLWPKTKKGCNLEKPTSDLRGREKFDRN